MPKQLPLELKLSGHATFSSFVTGGNAELVDLLQTIACGQQHGLVWIAGDLGSGRTHLLQACCRAASAVGLPSMYLPLAVANRVAADALEGAADLALLALDDVPCIAGDAKWESALFALLNACLHGGVSVVMTANDSPQQVSFDIPDLDSRVRAAAVYRAIPLADDNHMYALQQRAAVLGLTLDDAACRYLLTRVERDMPAIFSWLDRLDSQSLADQSRITVPMIRRLLAAQGAAANLGQE